MLYKQGSFITGVLSAASAADGHAAIWRILLNYYCLIYSLSANGKESWKMIQKIGMNAEGINLPPKRWYLHAVSTSDQLYFLIYRSMKENH